MLIEGAAEIRRQNSVVGPVRTTAHLVVARSYPAEPEDMNNTAPACPRRKQEGWRIPNKKRPENR